MRRQQSKAAKRALRNHSLKLRTGCIHSDRKEGRKSFLKSRHHVSWRETRSPPI